jgi:hypothetical protein
MITTGAKNILGRRPNIIFVAPRSGLTIPEPERITTPATPKIQRINGIIQKLENVAAVAEAVEKLVADRAKGEVLRLNLSNPDDAVVAQAAARLFPDKAINKDGFVHVPEITFPMYNDCIQHMKATGKAAGAKQLVKQTGPFKADRTDLGGSGSKADRRPEVNQSTIPFAPIDLPAFIAAGIPILFGMLFPLINTAIKKDIVAHTHIDPISGLTGPGVPVLPV